MVVINRQKMLREFCNTWPKKERFAWLDIVLNIQLIPYYVLENLARIGISVFWDLKKM